MTEAELKESPFTPGRPVQPEYFIARADEIKRLERAIQQTGSGRNENIFITGQRGIGKSSLASFLRFIGEKNHNMLGVHCHLGGVESLEELMAVLFQRMLSQCNEPTILDRLKNIFKDYIKSVTLLGIEVEFTADKTKLHGILDNFIPTLEHIYNAAKNAGRRGLILILDDINGIAEKTAFANFIKSFVDELATSRKKLPLLLVFVGLPERRTKLMENQPSIGRILDVVELKAMNGSETALFFRDMFAKSRIEVTDCAMTNMVKFSGGLPMLMHEIGDAVFWQDSDGIIDDSDAKAGIMEAAKNVGRKYVDPNVAKVLKSKIYGSMLWRMGEQLPIGTSFNRQDLLKKGSNEEKKNLDNFLSRARKLGIMEAMETKGEYRFVNALYHLYVWLAAKQQQKNLSVKKL